MSCPLLKVFTIFSLSITYLDTHCFWELSRCFRQICVCHFVIFLKFIFVRTLRKNPNKQVFSSILLFLFENLTSPLLSYHYTAVTKHTLWPSPPLFHQFSVLKLQVDTTLFSFLFSSYFQLYDYDHSQGWKFPLVCRSGPTKNAIDRKGGPLSWSQWTDVISC